MLHEDSNTGEISFVIIADIANDGDGGTLKCDISCLPNGAYVAVSDDAGELTGSPPTISGNFTWSDCCTDGGVISGLSCGYSFTMDITEITGISTIRLIYGDPANPIYVDLPASACPFVINCGGEICCADVFTMTADITDANCEDSEDGAIDLSVDAQCLGTPQFEWSNGETTEDISGLMPGVYTVTVTDPDGCSSSESYTVGVAYPNPTPMIEGPDWFCQGEAIVLGVSGNWISYEWSTGDNSPEIQVSTPGTYSVTVTNEGGCSGTADHTIVEYPAPVPVITGPTEFCPGQTITLDAGPGFSLYEWTTGQYTQTTIVSDQGLYSVIVTDNNGCTGEATTTITQLPGPEPFIFGPTSLCKGQTIILEVDDIYESYLWSTGSTIPQIEVTAPGTYSVTVTNQEACPGIDQYMVTEALITPLIILGDTLKCNGDSTTLSAGYVYAEYHWSSGEQTPGIQAPVPGSVSLIVVDSIGCRDTASVNLYSFPNPQPQIMGNPAFCPNVPAQLSVGSGYPAVVWSTGETTPGIQVSQAGQVTVTVQDSAGCQGMDTIQVAALSADTTLQFASSCNPSDTGLFVKMLVNQLGCDSVIIRSVKFNLADTTSLIAHTCIPAQAGITTKNLKNQYGCDSLVVTQTLLDPTTSSFAQIHVCDAAAAGLDTLILPNQYGCDSLAITEAIFVPSDTFEWNETTCDPDLADTMVTILPNEYGCDSVIIHRISLLPSSLEVFTLYSCNPTDTGSVVQTYVNQYGCDSTLVFNTLLVPLDSCSLKVNATIYPGPCAGDPGRIRFQASLGTFPVQINWFLAGGGQPGTGSWSNIFNPFWIDDLSVGDWVIQMIDANGYPWTDTLTISSPSPLAASLIGPAVQNGYDLGCAGDSDGFVQVINPSGGTPPLTYLWSTGGTGTQISGLGAGVYSVTISDAKGCDIVLSDTLSAPPPLSALWSLFQDPCDGIPASVSGVQVQGGAGTPVYLINGIPVAGTNWPPLSGEDFLLTVEDGNGCRTDTTIHILPEGTIQVDLGPDQLVEEGTLVKLFANVLPDTTALGLIQWIPALCPACLDPAIRVFQDTTVTLTITSASGCSATDAVLIELDRRSVFIPNSFSPNGDGINDWFAPQGDPAVLVTEFYIFDRWGEAIFQGKPFHLGDPDSGWNGELRGDKATIDVYVYVMKVIWPDGRIGNYKGDLTLTR